MELAREKGRDLVCVAPQSIPPVCRILDYGKFKYEIGKKERETKKRQHSILRKIKEIKLRPWIDEHDYQVKLRKAIDFLEKGYKLRLTLTFRGREMRHEELGNKILERIIADLGKYGSAEGSLKKLGRRLTLIMNSTCSHSQEGISQRKEE